MKKNFSYTLILIMLCVRVSVCEIVTTSRCPDDNGECEIHEVRINPCGGARDTNTCAIKRGQQAEISFDFTPKFSTRKLRSMVYWVNGQVDHSFYSMNPDGCQYTFCPITNGSRHSYVYPMEISKKLPTGTYPIKWVLWSLDDDTQKCCFMSSVEL